MSSHWLRGVGLVILGALAAPAHAQPFISPIAGIPYQDWTIWNYVDLNPAGGILDWRGGQHSYNGHDGLDFTLPHHAAMDAGVPVYAAADGVVIEKRDGLYDRNIALDEWPLHNLDRPDRDNQGNYIAIDHGNGIVTRYMHLRENSINADVGKIVSAGQTIGLVGSSGNSSQAHLHFSVYDHGKAFETYENGGLWWRSPVPYALDVRTSLDHGIVNNVPTHEQFLERPASHDVFVRSGSVQKAVFWMQLSNISANDDFEFYYYRPDGTQAAYHIAPDVPGFQFTYWTDFIDLPANAPVGTWTVDFLLNHVKMLSDTFVVRGYAADFNNDGSVNGADLGRWRTSAAANSDADADADGDSDGADFLLWQRQVGLPSIVAAAAIVPEPESLNLAIPIALIATVLRRRRLLG